MNALKSINFLSGKGSSTATVVVGVLAMLALLAASRAAPSTKGSALFPK